MGNNIYFLKDKNKLSKVISELLENYYNSSYSVLTKMHFGEPGNKFSYNVEDIIPLVEGLKTIGYESLLFDTPVIYPSIRNSVEGYYQLIKDKGFDKISKCKIEDEYEKLQLHLFDIIASKSYLNSENVLILSHVKGHSCAGFGGAIKNLAMGCVGKSTKIVQHSLGSPIFVKDCLGCGACVRDCPEKAIELNGNKAIINYKRCVGCSICIDSCIFGCLNPKKAMFDNLLGFAAAGLINNQKGKSFYINTLLNITKKCDCNSCPGEIIADDIGILFGDNPIAIDKASIDLVNKYVGENIFQKENKKDPHLQIQYTSKYTNLTSDYNLIEI